MEVRCGDCGSADVSDVDVCSGGKESVYLTEIEIQFRRREKSETEKKGQMQGSAGERHGVGVWRATPTEYVLLALHRIQRPDQYRDTYRRSIRWSSGRERTVALVQRSIRLYCLILGNQLSRRACVDLMTRHTKCPPTSLTRRGGTTVEDETRCIIVSRSSIQKIEQKSHIRSS